MGTKKELDSINKELQKQVEELQKDEKFIKKDDETLMDFIGRTWTSIPSKLKATVYRLYDEENRQLASYRALYYRKKDDPDFQLKVDRKEIPQSLETLLATNGELYKDDNETLTDFVFRIMSLTKMKLQDRLMVCRHFDTVERSENSYRGIYNKRKNNPDYEFVENVNNQHFKNINEKSNITYKNDGSISADLSMRLLDGEDEMDAVYRKLGINKNLFQIGSLQQSRWNAQSSDGVIEMCAVKVKLKPIVGVDITVEKMTKLFEELPKFKVPRIEKNTNVKTDNNLMVEIPLMDVHFNKRTENYISGQDFNSNVAEKRLNAVIDQTIESFPNAHTFIMQIGQDFFNIDNYAGSTTGGTPQDIHQSVEIMWNHAFRVVVEQITKLAAIAKKVIIPYVPGNHGKLLSWMLVKALEAYFNGNKTIVFDSRPDKRKYIKWGTNLIGFSHGDKEHKNLPFLMQQEAAQDWADTTHREWHLGHLHHLATQEKGGIIFRRLSALSGTDRWHKESGYVGSKEGAQIFEWHKKKGLLNIKYIIF